MSKRHNLRFCAIAARRRLLRRAIRAGHTDCNGCVDRPSAGVPFDHRPAHSGVLGRGGGPEPQLATSDRGVLGAVRQPPSVLEKGKPRRSTRRSGGGQPAVLLFVGLRPDSSRHNELTQSILL